MFSYKVGDAFLHMPQSRVLKRLERDQMSIDGKVKVATLALQADECEVQMKGLKVVLYAKLAKLLIWTNENKKNLLPLKWRKH